MICILMIAIGGYYLLIDIFLKRWWKSSGTTNYTTAKFSFNSCRYGVMYVELNSLGFLMLEDWTQLSPS